MTAVLQIMTSVFRGVIRSAPNRGHDLLLLPLEHNML